MKKIRTRSTMVLLMTLAFFAGLIYHTTKLVIHAEEWTSMPQNAHLLEVGGLEYAGTVYDTNGVPLAMSINGERIYNPDETIRKACLHIVGDNTTNIINAVQTVYRSQLTNYDFTFALGLPNELKTGNNITLTIDSRLQKAAYNALGNKRGAVVFYNYRTGEIVCIVSTPSYDPQNIPEDIETNDEYEGAYINRAISASYPPGSTFKLVTGAAALDNLPNVENRLYTCMGSDTIGDKSVTCYSVSGQIDFRQALSESCNGYFAHLAVDLDKDRMTNQAEKMGFNSSIEFDGFETIKSTYDVSQASKNDLAWSGVGQYTVLETPLNMAMISAAIANHGTPVMPYVIKDISNCDYQTEIKFGKKMMSTSAADTLAEMMDYTVENNYGKSYVCENLDVCAKTGTAEIDGEQAHAWVTGFCKDVNCPLAFSVIVEHGDSGYLTAIPVATAVLNECAKISG